MWLPTLNKSPAFPFKRISFGPVGQSEEIKQDLIDNKILING